MANTSTAPQGWLGGGLVKIVSWHHLRTTNPIESLFAPVKARTRKTRGAGSRRAGLALAYKLVSSAERHWRRVRAPHLVALVRAGVKFHNGVLVSEQFQSTSAIATVASGIAA